MKHAFVLLLAFCSIAAAQTVSTNWIRAHEDFRMVRGQLYNVRKSALSLEIHGRITFVSNNVAIMDTTIPKTNSVVLRVRGDELSRQGNFLGGRVPDNTPLVRVSQVPGPMIAVTNLPESDMVWARQGVWRGVQVGRYSFLGNPIALYDLGEPHVVPVVVTNKSR